MERQLRLAEDWDEQLSHLGPPPAVSANDGQGLFGPIVFGDEVPLVTSEPELPSLTTCQEPVGLRLANADSWPL